MAGFTEKDVVDQSGKTFFITGANTGLGFHASRVIAKQGGRVLMGCRSRKKAEAAKARILSDNADASIDIIDIDLGDLESIHKAAKLVGEESRLDVLVNNAGLMMPPYQKTKDGFESQFGVNHLGGFALTALLLPKLSEQQGARVVMTSSNAHKMAKVNFNDLQAEKKYSPLKQYSMTKMANLLHTYALARRLQKSSNPTLAVCVHPGGSDTDLMRHSKMMRIMMPLGKPFLNSASQGAWPTLLGATGASVNSGDYFGPKGLGELGGPAKKVSSNALSHDESVQEKMWEISEALTGVTYPV